MALPIERPFRIDNTNYMNTIPDRPSKIITNED